MANQHFELARLDDTVGIRIDDSALRNRNIERNGLGLTGSSSTRWNALSSRSVQL